MPGTMPGIQIRCPASWARGTDRAPASAWAGPVRSSSGSSSTRTDPMSAGRGRPGTATARKDASIAPERMAATAVSMSNSITTSRSISGCARWKPRSRPAAAPREAITSTRSGRRPVRTDATARSATRSSSRAWGRNACPSMVSRAPRAVRVNSRTPRVRSSAAMRLETACWVTASSAAASWNCPASAAATKVRTVSRSIPGTLRAQPLVVAGRSRGCLTPGCGARFDASGRGSVVRVRGEGRRA